MSASNVQNVLTGAAMLGLLIGGLACAHKYDLKNLEGAWACKTPWTWTKEDGSTAPCSAELHVTCRDGRFTGKGVISLGDAQWDETSAGTCGADGEELYGERTSVKTVPKNDAARQFEKEKLGGRGLADTQSDGPTPYRVRITALTETQLIHVNDEGRTTTCTRP